MINSITSPDRFAEVLRERRRAMITFDRGRVVATFDDGDTLETRFPEGSPRYSTPGSRACLQVGGRMLWHPDGSVDVHLRDGRRQRVPAGLTVPPDDAILALVMAAAGRRA